MKIINYLKKDAVLCAALLLAAVSMFIVAPDKEYASYIDADTLLLLFALMSVMAGLRNCSFFRFIGKSIINKVKTERQLVLVLVLLPFIFSMFMTNDVALIIFVPLALIILKLSCTEKYTVFVVAAQTVAANLGSMLMPTGNPQNLYLFSIMKIKLTDFIKLMLPYSLCALLMLIIWCILASERKSISVEIENDGIHNIRAVAVCLFLFIICLLSVAKLFPALISAALCLTVFFVMDRKALLMVDYNLLLTFAGFFVFIGNMSRIETVKTVIEALIKNHEVIMAVLLSQVISNVPCALLMSGFTQSAEGLVIGTNLGGLGTLIASMASLISYKFVVAEKSELKGRYFRYFTLSNIIFLAILLSLYFIIG